ncbi:MAG: AMP-binding protein [Pseudomonadota bacterium]
MNKPWLAHYGDRIPHEIDADRYQNVVTMLLEAAEKYAEKPAYASFGGTQTYAAVRDLGRDFAAYLQSELGIEKGDRVAVMLPNMMAFPIAMQGILRAGAVQVNVNPMYTARELEHQLNDAAVETIVVFAGSTPTLAEVLENTPIKTVIVAQLDDFVGRGVPDAPQASGLENTARFTDAVAAGADLPFSPPEIASDDLIFLQYTGGTTGLSKGAMLTHRNLVANVLQFEAFANDGVNYGNEVVITAIPMYHIFALMVNTLSYHHFGGTSVLITNPADMPAFVEEWSKWPVTVFSGVNTLYNGLLHTPGFAELDFSRLSLAVGGGAPVQKAVSDKWKAVTGKHIKEGYGLSETSPVLTMNPFGMEEFLSSIGIPWPSTDISLRDDEGREVPQGEEGELCARGPQVMKGYWRRDDATAEVMTGDGYFRTGDVAVMDPNGFFRIVDRKKDMILVSGFNVFPNEIESVVAALDGVLECACIGVPDERTGEAVKLFVVKSDETLTAEAVEEHCREALTAYKVPKQITFIDALPKSTVGKILRRELRQL